MSTYLLSWTSSNDVSYEIDLGAEVDVRSIYISSRSGWLSSLNSASVTLSAGSGGSGDVCGQWNITDSFATYALGDPLPEGARGAADMFDLCCECGGGGQGLCRPRYLQVKLPYTMGYDGLVGGWRSLTFSEVEFYDADGVEIIPATSNALTDGNLNTYVVEWSDGRTLTQEIDLGAEYEVRTVIISSRSGRPDSLNGASVGLYSRSGGAGCAYAEWNVTNTGSIYKFGDTLSGNAFGKHQDGDDLVKMLDECCECGGGTDVSVGWLRDYGYGYGSHDSNSASGSAGVDFGWRCPVASEDRGTTAQSRAYEAGWTRPMMWATCASTGDDGASENEFNLRVPYAGAYLFTIHWQDIGGTQAMEVAVENHRLIGSVHAVADHVDGVSEMVVVDVLDGNLTLTAVLTGRSKINWIQVEKLADAVRNDDDDTKTTATSGNDRVWLPTTDEAYWELKLEEENAPVGLVVVELPGSDMMTPEFEAYGSSFAIPSMRHKADDDSRFAWFYDPPSDSVSLSMAIRYGQHLNLSQQLDEYGYPSFCDANMEDDRKGLLLDPFLDDRKHLHERSADFPCSMSPSGGTEFGEAEYTDQGGDRPLTASRWWGHTGGRPSRGAVVSVSNTSCASEDADCGAEPGDPSADEVICKVRWFVRFFLCSRRNNCRLPSAIDRC